MSGYTGLVDATIDFVVGTFDAQDVRLGAIGNALPGLYAKNDFTVAQRAAGANMSVDISSGRCFLEPGGPASQQGCYLARSETTYNTSSDGGYTWTAADPTNPRTDLLCIEAADVDEGGSFTGYKFRIVDGTANASATHQLITQYWPAIPNYVVPLAAINIPAADATINTASISNLNPIGGSSRTSYNSNGNTADTTTSASFVRLTNSDAVFVYVPNANARVKFGYKAQWKSSAAQVAGIGLFIGAANSASVQLKAPICGAPVTSDYELNLGAAALYSHLGTQNPSNATTAATLAGFISIAGVTGDASDVATGQILGSGTSSTQYIGSSPLEIFGLTAGWYLFEPQYKIAGGATLSVRNRYSWVEVSG